MSLDRTLRDQQWEAYWEALKVARLSCPGWVWLERKEQERRALENATEKAKRAYAARSRRAERSYLPPNVVLPVGTPAPELMREAAKRAVTSVRLWAENAPEHGCHEMRKRIGSRDMRSVPTWGKSRPKDTFQPRHDKVDPDPNAVSRGW